MRTFRDSDYLVRGDISNDIHNTTGPPRLDVVDVFVRTNSEMET